MISGTTKRRQQGEPEDEASGKPGKPRHAEGRPLAPSTSASVADTAATSRLVTAAARNASLFKSAPYQRVENPAHTVTSP